MIILYTFNHTRSRILIHTNIQIHPRNNKNNSLFTYIEWIYIHTIQLFLFHTHHSTHDTIAMLPYSYARRMRITHSSLTHSYTLSRSYTRWPYTLADYKRAFAACSIVILSRLTEDRTTSGPSVDREQVSNWLHIGYFC